MRLQFSGKLIERLDGSMSEKVSEWMSEWMEREFHATERVRPWRICGNVTDEAAYNSYNFHYLVKEICSSFVVFSITVY